MSTWAQLSIHASELSSMLQYAFPISDTYLLTLRQVCAKGEAILFWVWLFTMKMRLFHHITILLTLIKTGTKDEY